MTKQETKRRCWDGLPLDSTEPGVKAILDQAYELCERRLLRAGLRAPAVNTTTKICAGEYERTDGRNKVRVTRVEYPNDGTYWIAAAQWDSRTSDPLLTKRDAIRSADYMLETADDPAFNI